jgi:hypothetical protein
VAAEEVCDSRGCTARVGSPARLLDRLQAAIEGLGHCFYFPETRCPVVAVIVVGRPPRTAIQAGLVSEVTLLCATDLVIVVASALFAVVPALPGQNLSSHHYRPHPMGGKAVGPFGDRNSWKC